MQVLFYVIICQVVVPLTPLLYHNFMWLSNTFLWYFFKSRKSHEWVCRALHFMVNVLIDLSKSYHILLWMPTIKLWIRNDMKWTDKTECLSVVPLTLRTIHLFLLIVNIFLWFFRKNVFLLYNAKNEDFWDLVEQNCM